MKNARLIKSIYSRLNALKQQWIISLQDIKDFKKDVLKSWIKVHNFSTTNRAIALMDPTLRQKYEPIINAVNPKWNFDKYLTQQDRYKTTYNFLKQKLWTELDKNNMKEFINNVHKTAERYWIKLDTNQWWETAMSKLNPAILNKHTKEYNTLAQGIWLQNLEKKIGSAWAEFVNNEIGTDSQQKTFEQILDQVKQDPQFNNFFNQYKDFINKDYNINADTLNQNLDFTEQSIQQKQQQTQQNFDNLNQDIEQYKKYSNDDYIRNLAKIDTNLSGSLQRATEAYWQRNMLQSWLARIASQQSLLAWDTQKQDQQTQLQRKLSDATKKLQRWKEILRNNLNSLQLDKEKAEFNTQQQLKWLDLQREKALNSLDVKKTSEEYGMATDRFNKTMNKKANQVRNFLNTKYNI